MATDITLTPRKIYLEDLSTTTSQAGETEAVNVLGAAVNPVTLNKLALVLLTQFSSYANDAAAAAGGIPVGGLYYSSTYSKLHTRMT